MNNEKNAKQFKELQVVEIDQNKFAIQMTNGNINVNLSNMAKPFGAAKKPANWLRTKESKEYINALPDSHICASADLVKVMKGGNPDEQGTWANDYRIAMRFAQWLSPEFAIKVDEMLLNMLLKRPVKQAALPQNASYPENQVFMAKLERDVIMGYYTNGVLYFQLSKIARYIGYDNGGSHFVNYSPENAIRIKIDEKREMWFVNMDCVDAILKRCSFKSIPYEKISHIYRDLFGVEVNQTDSETFSYRFTDKQMLEIFEIIFDKPINKEKVIEKLRNGKI